MLEKLVLVTLVTLFSVVVLGVTHTVLTISTTYSISIVNFQWLNLRLACDAKFKSTAHCMTEASKWLGLNQTMDLIRHPTLSGIWSSVDVKMDTKKICA